ncbi:MAG TPA: tripartite tricarboxylate transporter permease [Spirochaetales bacterium]|nr:tripartite tricarboxylate transporter permease [Spirochaetales bacterium]
MNILNSLTAFLGYLGTIVTSPFTLLLLFGATILGIIFGALPGLTATLGVALLTTLTYSLDTGPALVALLGIYVGAVYGGSYGSIMINIPGTAAAAATALDGYPKALRGEAGVAIGLTTTVSFIGTIVGMFFVVIFTPLISFLALQFTSFEFFLLAFFGILISGSISTPDLVQKGWLAGFIGLFLAIVGRDPLQFYPRFTLGFPQLDGGIEVVPVLIGAFGIPQIIQVLKDRFVTAQAQQVGKIIPSWGKIIHNLPHIIRSALIGVGIGAVPGIGEDIAAWVSYGTAKNTSKHPEQFGTGCDEGIIASETANNACIGGAMIPLLSLGIPGSPPAAMLLGALLLHGIAPGPMLHIEQPTFVFQVSAILLMASVAMYVCGILLAPQVVKLLRVPPALFMPIVAVLCLIGSYALGLKIFNLYLMVPIGIVAYYMGELGYPIPPLVIGVILGTMADENLRRALMVSQGSFLPFFTRPVSIILLIVILVTVVTSTATFKAFKVRWQQRKASS